MNEKIKDLLHKALIAQALGDAFGYIVEFNDWKTIRAKYGDEGLKYQPESLTLNASDDTQMTLFCLNALIEERIKANKESRAIGDPTVKIYENYLAWLYTQNLDKKPLKENFLLSFKELYKRQAPGNTCLSALMSNKMGSIENPINDSKGCGTIMRTMPVAFYAHSAEQAFEWGAKQGAITHGHPEGYLSSGVYSAIVYELIYNTRDIIKATQKASAYLDNYKHNQTMKNTINKTLWLLRDEPQMQNDTMTQALGQGWVAEEALSVAIYCAATSVSFAQVLEKSSNHSGDSDSTAMLAAGLWYLSTLDDSFMRDSNHLDLYNCINQLIQKI